jgi:hypothetical protein
MVRPEQFFVNWSGMIIFRHWSNPGHFSYVCSAIAKTPKKCRFALWKLGLNKIFFWKVPRTKTLSIPNLQKFVSGRTNSPRASSFYFDKENNNRKLIKVAMGKVGKPILWAMSRSSKRGPANDHYTIMSIYQSHC